MNISMIQKTEQFLKETFQNSAYLQDHPQELAYRLEHSYRVANIGKQIAEAEDLNPTDMVIACLLHDISYCRELSTREERMNHGRTSAQIARPFLQELSLPEKRVNDILYGISIHVDDSASFEWERSPFTETVGDADNIDRFDAYRIYETLEFNQFSKLSLAEKLQKVTATLDRLTKLQDMKLATQTADKLWQERLNFYISFYEKLLSQLNTSTSIQ